MTITATTAISAINQPAGPVVDVVVGVVTDVVVFGVVVDVVVGVVVVTPVITANAVKWFT
jgi:molybdopterin-binding protein